MATRASHATRPAEAPARQPGSPLGVLDRRPLLDRAARRQVRALVVLSAVVVAAALVVVAGGHALIASGQVRLDSTQAEIASALAREQNLQLERAQLEAPSRVLRIAETELKMVTPSSVVYLPPVDPGETVYAAHQARHTSTSSRR